MTKARKNVKNAVLIISQSVNPSLLQFLESQSFYLATITECNFEIYDAFVLQGSNRSVLRVTARPRKVAVNLFIKETEIGP